jgi:hypothetical protein
LIKKEFFMNIRKKTVCGVLAVILALTFAACGDEDGESNTDKELSGNISISPSSATVGQILTATYTGTEAVSYQWKKEGGNVGTNSKNYTPAAAGSYTVTVSAAGYNSKTSAAVSVVSTGNDDDCDCNGVEEDCECVNCDCATCEPTDPTHIHEWGSYVVTTHPTCTTPGVETRTCITDARHTDTRTIAIDLNAHAWGAWVVTTPATATEDGEETRTCAHNASHVETNALASLDHTHVWGEWEVTTPPTCTEKGERERVCTLNNNHKDYEDIDPTGHDQGEWYILPATCTATGTKERLCTVDNAVLETDTIAALGHSYGDWTVTTVATCTTAGVEKRTCSRDALHTDTRDIPIDSNAHNWGNWVVTKEPTTMVTGIETRTCGNAANHIETRDVAVLETNSIYIYSQPQTIYYIINDTLDLTGLRVDAYYYYGSSYRNETVTITTANITGFNSATAGNKTVTVTYGGKTATFTVTVFNTNNMTVTNLNEWNGVLNIIRTRGNNRSYTINVSSNISVPGSTANTFGTVTGISVTLQGNGRLSLNSNGRILSLAGNQTLYINDTNLTLQGRSGNNETVVHVGDSAKLELLGGTISGNTSSGNITRGGGVSVYNGNFTMSGGTISENVSINGGGGVYVNNGNFTMSGGTISNNNASNYSTGGGVYVRGSGSSFTLSGGTISGNISSSTSGNYGGGGVYVTDSGSFTMTSGTIISNTSNAYGGGVYIDNMTYGGTTSFSKTGGIIYGNNANTADKNTAASGDTYGHAVFYYDGSGGKYRDTNLNSNDNLSTSSVLPTTSGQTLNGWTRR